MGILLSSLWLLYVTCLLVVPSLAPTVSEWLSPCNQSADPLCLFQSPSALRVVALVALPLFLGWALGYGVAWVRSGFGNG